jgi:hypothetical protein
MGGGEERWPGDAGGLLGDGRSEPSIEEVEREREKAVARSSSGAWAQQL